MAIERLTIKDFLKRSKGNVLLDVRSPGEYNHAHIPSATGFPLFTDEERKVVGTTYKQKSREEAIKIGLDFFGPKMRKMVEEVEGMFKNPEVGNQRSAVESQKGEIFCLLLERRNEKCSCSMAAGSIWI